MTTRRRALLAGVAALVAASLRRLGRLPVRITQRTSPGTRARALDVGGHTILVREDFFETGTYSNLRGRGPGA